MLGFLLSVRDQLEVFLRILLVRVARTYKAFTTISQPYVYFPASSHRYYPLRSIIPPSGRSLTAIGRGLDTERPRFDKSRRSALPRYAQSLYRSLPRQRKSRISGSFLFGRVGFEPTTLGLRGGRRDLRRSRPSWKTSDFEPISAERSPRIPVEPFAPLLPL